MGTFHQHRGELHGITVAVETASGEFWIGRCDVADARGVLLHDADVHRPGAADAGTRDTFLRKALAVGVWPRHADVMLPATEVTSITRLSELG